MTGVAPNLDVMLGPSGYVFHLTEEGRRKDGMIDSLKVRVKK
jgi:hypothetical protein